MSESGLKKLYITKIFIQAKNVLILFKMENLSFPIDFESESADHLYSSFQI